jgi:O-acetyl-ADP-ribose deacetylase (regulator of RNase III)
MKKLIYRDGNLLTDKIVEVIGQQCNCQNTFGSGIARSIREMYPEAYQADCVAAAKKENTLGNFSWAHVGNLSRTNNGTNIQYIYNLYGQNLGTRDKKVGDRMTNYEALYSAFAGMAKRLGNDPFAEAYGHWHYEPTVGFPFLIGCALGGGNWDVVSRLIEVAFDGYGGDVHIIRLKQ